MSFPAKDGNGLSVSMAAVGDGSSTPYAASNNIAYFGGTAVTIGQGLSAASIPVVVASNQSNLPCNLAAVGGSVIALGSALAAASIPVVIASNQGNLPTNIAQVGGASVALGNTTMSASVPVTVASNQSAIPNNVTQVGGASLALGNTTMSASLPVTVASNQSNLPCNVAAVGGTAVTAGQAAMASSVPVVIASNQTAVPGNITQVGSSNIATAASGIAKVGLCDGSGTAFTAGQGLMAASLPVVIASNQSNLPANVAAFGGTSVTIGQGTMAASIPVVIASNQTNLPANITQVGGASLALGQAAMAASVPVVLASNQTNVPANVAQIGGSNVVSATTGVQKVGIADSSGTSITLGQTTMSASIPVALASNQTAFPVQTQALRGSVTTYCTTASIPGGEADLGTGFAIGNYSRIVAVLSMVVSGNPTGGATSVILQTSIDNSVWVDVAIFSAQGVAGNATPTAIFQAGTSNLSLVASGTLARGLSTANQDVPLAAYVRFTGYSTLTGGTPASTATIKYQLVG